jgi:hypothetical protein
MRKFLVLSHLLYLTSLEARADEFPVPAIPWNPEHYICYRTDSPITIDGKPDEATWSKAAWTSDFVDIEGASRPTPRFQTRAKMLWDDRYFYVAATMEEPDVWGTLTERDAVIYHDNDFEVFIDPDGDTHKYYELEINALGTEWDLFLVTPYRDGGPALTGWDIRGLLTGVHVMGTLNQPGDRDRGWTTEIAFPWPALKEHADTPTPPRPGDQWRVNFSRVEWKTDVRDGQYVKLVNPDTGNPLPEDNWVWSPQGLIAMHYPEMWGFVQFSQRVAGHGEDPFLLGPREAAAWALREIYYEEKIYFSKKDRFTEDLSNLRLKDFSLGDYTWPPGIRITDHFFEVTLERKDGETLHISQDGHLW